MRYFFGPFLWLHQRFRMNLGRGIKDLILTNLTFFRPNLGDGDDTTVNYLNLFFLLFTTLEWMES